MGIPSQLRLVSYSPIFDPITSEDMPDPTPQEMLTNHVSGPVKWTSCASVSKEVELLVQPGFDFHHEHRRTSGANEALLHSSNLGVEVAVFYYWYIWWRDVMASLDTGFLPLSRTLLTMATFWIMPELLRVVFKTTPFVDTVMVDCFCVLCCCCLCSQVFFQQNMEECNFIRYWIDNWMFY